MRSALGHYDLNVNIIRTGDPGDTNSQNAHYLITEALRCTLPPGRKKVFSQFFSLLFQATITCLLNQKNSIFAFFFQILFCIL